MIYSFLLKVVFLWVNLLFHDILFSVSDIDAPLCRSTLQASAIDSVKVTSSRIRGNCLDACILFPLKGVGNRTSIFIMSEGNVHHIAIRVRTILVGILALRLFIRIMNHRFAQVFRSRSNMFRETNHINPIIIIW